MYLSAHGFLSASRAICLNCHRYMTASMCFLIPTSQDQTRRRAIMVPRGGWLPVYDHSACLVPSHSASRGTMSLRKIPGTGISKQEANRQASSLSDGFWEVGMLSRCLRAAEIRQVSRTPQDLSRRRTDSRRDVSLPQIIRSCLYHNDSKRMARCGPTGLPTPH